MSAPKPVPSFLLDSSVLVKWYHDEDEAEIALRLRDGHLREQWELRLADLSLYELANALHFSGNFTPEEIIEHIQSLLAMDLNVYGFDLQALRAALDVCAAKGVSIYDAYLVALAKNENLTFVTADGKLLRKLGTDEAILALRRFLTRFDGKEVKTE